MRERQEVGGTVGRGERGQERQERLQVQRRGERVERGVPVGEGRGEAEE